MTGKYRKLTRKKRAISGSTQLWLGDDHVLMVRSSHFAEEYRRFQLADIQSVIACEAPSRSAMQTILIIIGALCFFAVFGSDTMFSRVFFSLVGAVFLGAAAYDMLRGTRCRCRLLTEVSTELLEPVTRFSDYRRLMVHLQPAIEAVQGRLDVTDPNVIIPAASGPAFYQPPETPIGAQKYLQPTFYGILLLTCVAYVLFYFWRYEEGFSVGLSGIGAEVLVAILLLSMPERFGVTGVLKTLLIGVSILVAADIVSVVSQISSMVYQVAEAGRTNTKPPVIWDIPWMMTLAKISITWRVIAGATGLIAFWMGREAAPSQPQP